MNRETWIKLTPKQQRIKVAELHGWKQKMSAPWVNPEGLCRNEVPDYLNNLNAMHEAVWSQDNFGFLLRYCANLELIVLGPANLSERRDSSVGRFRIYSATAAQRAEAFVLAMEPE